MVKYIILLSFLFCSLGLDAQVYFSQYVEQAYVGPNNVNKSSLHIADYEIDKITAQLEYLTEIVDELQAFDSQKKPKRKQKLRMKMIRSSKTKIHSDIKHLNELLSQWVTHKKLLVQIKSLNIDCFDFSTSNMDLNNKTAHIETEMVEGYLDFYEYIPVKLEKFQKSQWVKKKADKNCLSPNPDDCLVWCLVNEVLAYEDLLGKIYNYDPSINVHKFSFDKLSNRIIKPVGFAVNFATIHQLIGYDNPLGYSIEGIHIVDCGE